MTKLGLVFSGGGGKGAYEIGVWKALREFDMDKGVQAVAGTSVGGLNGALFVQGDLAAGEHLWQNIAPDKILKIDATQIAAKIVSLAARLSIPANPLLTIASSLKNQGWFTQDGLRQLIQESGVCLAIQKSDIPFYICALNGNSGELEIPNLSGRPQSEIEKWLLASAAIPLIYGGIEINGKQYHDGGVVPRMSNNTPYEPLINNHGCTHIITIWLDNASLMHKAQSKYPAIKFWNIVPTASFKNGKFAALDFSPSTAWELIERGYADAKKILLQFHEFQRTEEDSLEHINHIYSDKHRFDTQLDVNNELSHGQLSAPDNPMAVLDQLNGEIDRRELDLIDHGLNDFIERFGDNAQTMQEAMFEGISTLGATEGRIKYAMNCGCLAKVWDGITGQSGHLTAEVQWDLNRAVYFNQTLIQKLNERNALTLETVSSLGSRMNYIMGHTNYLTAASNFHHKAIKMLAENVAQLQIDLNRRLDQTEGRIERLENRDNLEMWLLGLPEEIKQLSPALAVLKIIRGFYKHTHGAWQPDEYLALNGQTLTICKGDSCTLNELIDAAAQFPPMLGLGNIQPVITDSAPVHPAYSVICTNPQTTSKILEQHGLSLTAQVSVSTLIAELLCSMRLHHAPEHNLLAQYTEKSENLKQICTTTGLSEYVDQLQAWQQEMQEFRLLTPLIGKFSAGKSTLLNALLGRDLLGVDLDPKTADASELHFSDKEYAEGIYLNGERKPCSDVKAILPSFEDNHLWYYQRHINNSILKTLGKLVLVDMPGLDSSHLNHSKALANYIDRGEIFLGVLSSEAAFDNSVMDVLREAHSNNKEIHLVVTKCARQTGDKLKEIRHSLNGFFAGCDPAPEIVLVESLSGEPGIRDFISMLIRLSSRFDDFFENHFEPMLLQFEEQIRQKLKSELKLASYNDAEHKQQMVVAKKTFAKLKETIITERITLERRLKGEGAEQVVAAVLQVLDGNSGRLLSAAESGSLQQTIASIIRPVVQTQAQQVIAAAMADFNRRLEKVVKQSEQAELSPDINIAVMSPQLKEGNSGAVAAGIGAVIGTVIAGPIGALIGGIFGKLFGGNKDKIREENRTLIQSQVIPQVLSSVRQQLQFSFAEHCKSVVNNTQQFIDQQQETFEDRQTKLLEESNQKRQHHEEQRKQLQQAILAVDNNLAKQLPLTQEHSNGQIEISCTV